MEYDTGTAVTAPTSDGPSRIIGAFVDPGTLDVGVDFTGPSLRRSEDRRRQEFIIILRVLDEGQAQLLFVGLAGGAAGILPYLLENGEQDGGEDRDDSDHNEQFDQRKAAEFTSAMHNSYPLLSLDGAFGNYLRPTQRWLQREASLHHSQCTISISEYDTNVKR